MTQTKDINKIKIITDRCILRTMLVEDVTPDYPKWLNDPNTNKFLDFDTEQTIDSCIDYVKYYYSQNTKALIGIFTKNEDLHIGNLTLSMIDWKNKYAWVGITIGLEKFRQTRIAKETLLGLERYCFKDLGLHAFRAGVSTKNIASLNFFLKCGYSLEGVLRESGVINGEFINSYILSKLETE